MFNPFLQTRLSRVRDELGRAGLDALLLMDIVNVGYLTGFTGSTAYALVTNKDAILITDARYTLRAQTECPGFTIQQADVVGGYSAAITRLLIECGSLGRVGFEAGHVTVAQWQQLQKDNAKTLEWISTDGLIEELRLIKDAGEISAIRAAISLAESAWLEVKPLLRPGITEREFALTLEIAMRRSGADGAAFDTIVASGALGAHPHHHAGNRPVVAGDLVTVDWGATLNGYVSDITRTVSMAPASAKQRELYSIVLQAQRRAIAGIQPGVTGKAVDAIARDFLTECGFGEEFGHSLGHSIGRVVHDGSALSVRADTLYLKPGMILTVEPGIYLQDWGGIRIEEDVLVTEKGCEVLTTLPNDFEELG